MNPFIGRKKELKQLNALTSLNHACLCVVKGRRRIGKSRLLSEFAKSFSQAYIFSGLAPENGVTAQNQREEFTKQLYRQTDIRGITCEDWSDLFWHLSQYTKTGKTLIILDEITWMGVHDPSFLPKLKNAWDLYFSKNEDLILTISGSLSAWIEENILSSTGFLGRTSLELDLEELPLKDCLAFWRDGADEIANFEKLKVLNVTGGIPRYLENIDATETAEQNIKRLCFTKNAILTKEFKKVFSDLYSNNSTIYQKIVTALADGIANIETICKRAKIQRSGSISLYLDNLVQSGFISRDYTWHIKSGKYSKLSMYRLKDNYSRFFLKYIQPNMHNIQLGNMKDLNLNELPEYHSIMGLQFENLVLSNRNLIKQHLGIHPSDIVCDNPFFQRKTSVQAGCQIDYMIQTKFNTLYIFEIKFSSNEITSKAVEQMKQKIKRLKLPKHFSYRCVLIHTSQVSEAILDSHYFAHIINFANLIES